MNLRIAFVLACCFAISACISHFDLQASRDAFSHAKPCCADFTDLPFESLPPSGKVTVVMGPDSPAFDFGPLGISYFKAFALPPSDADVVVTASSLEMLDGRLGSPAKGSAYFFPVLTFLDSNKRPVARSIRADMKIVVHSNAPATAETGAIQQPSDHARYVVIHTSRDFLDNGLDGSVTAPGITIAAARGVFINLPGRGPESFHASGAPVGTIDIEVRNLK